MESAMAMATAGVGASKDLVKASAKKLDAAIAEIRELNATMAFGGWKVGGKIAALLESGLWKAMVGGNGKVKYDDFDVFVREELKMSPRYARTLVDVATSYSEAQFREIGVTKLKIILEAPAQAQAKLLEQAKGRSRDAINADVKAVKEAYARETGKEHRREKRSGGARKPKAATKPPKKPEKGEITVSLLMNEGQKVYFHRKDDAGELVPAKVSDLRKEGVKVIGALDLKNRVRLMFLIREASTGQLQIVVKPVRVS